jgi:hypothetical protein
MSEICVLNRSSLPDADVAFMSEACDVQLREHFLPVWPGLEYTPVRFVATETDLPVVSDIARLMVVADTIDIDGVAGYHQFVGVPRGVVLAQGKQTSVTLSHECLEMAADPTCTEWVDMPDGRRCAKEVADPCQAQSYEVEVTILGETRRVGVSEFVPPSWFTIGAPGAFQLKPGGYMIVRERSGNVHDVWASTATADQSFVRARKVWNSTSRTSRRGVT